MKKYLFILFLPLFAFECKHENDHPEVLELIKGPKWINDSTLTTTAGQNTMTYPLPGSQDWMQLTSNRYFYHSTSDSGSLNVYYQYENKIFYWKDGDQRPENPSFEIRVIGPDYLVTDSHDSTSATLLEKYYHSDH